MKEQSPHNYWHELGSIGPDATGDKITNLINNFKD